MNLEELENLLSDHEEYKRKAFRQDDNRAAALVVVRKRPPAGIKISTPFGRCEIANCQQLKSGEFQIVFFVTKRQIENIISTIKEANP